VNKISLDKIPSLKKLVDFVSPQVLKLTDKLKDFLPEEKARQSVGLDIGSSSVKLVQLQKTGRDFKLTSFGIEPIKKNNREEAIRQVLAASNVTVKKVNVSVSGQGVILRYVTMPKMALEDMRRSILLEADKYSPFPADEVITDCCIIEELPQVGKMLVLVAAAKKDLIEQRITLLDQAGLSPGVISIDAVALANVFNVFCQLPASAGHQEAPSICQTVGMLNIGETFSNLNIMDKGLPLFTRDIFIGGRDMTKRIMNQFSVDVEAAEKLKYSPEADGKKILESCETILTNLATEVRFSFDYFETENNLPIALLYITGGGSYLKGIDNFLQQSLGMKVECWNPVSGLQVEPEVPVELLKKEVNKFGVALGLALYQND
jgi:type IV pilus assembly protein PilM